MSNFSMDRLMQARAHIKRTGPLPIGARYAAIWHLERLNNVLKGSSLKVVRRDMPDGETLFDVTDSLTP